MNFDRNRIAAFTLIEILVALTIIGVLMSFIAPLVFDRPDQARLLKVKNDQKAIETSLRLFKLDNGTFPAAELGLNALLANGLTSNGYLPEEPMDPWGSPISWIIYRLVKSWWFRWDPTASFQICQKLEMTFSVSRLSERDDKVSGLFFIGDPYCIGNYRHFAFF
jgi:general secretion pathway protein G